MRDRFELSRREFVKAAAGAAVALGGASIANAETKQAVKKGRPKVGCLSWCFHSFGAGADPTEAIDIMGRIGFEGTELILNAREDITNFWTDDKIDKLKKKLQQNKLAVAQFVIFQPVVQGLSSLDADTRERNLDYFEAGCRIGKKLGAPMVNIVAPWARELGPEKGYLPRFYELPEPKEGEKYKFSIAEGFDWEAVWQKYIDTTKACLERAKAHDMKMSIEHHTHCIIPDATSFLRLWDAIKDDALGYNMDVGWTLLQREYPPVAIHKVAGHLMNLHMRDIDGTMRHFVHVGQGVMDFEGIAKALKAINFDGFLNIEQDKYPGDMIETCRRYLAIMKEHLA
jgi:sugar phosphate isomerase/epimerase